MKKQFLPFMLTVLTLFGFSLVCQAQMRVHHINVGQGDATLIEFKTAAVLIDAGGADVAADRYGKHLINYLDEFFERRFDLNKTLYSVIITHPHIDHTIFVMRVMERYKVLNFVDNGDYSQKIGQIPVNKARWYAKQKSIIYNKIRESNISNEGYQTQWFKNLEESQSRAEIRFINASRNCKDENNDSLVVLVRYGNTSLLVTGDSEWEEDSKCKAAIPRMLERYKNSNLMDIDIYKVSHHGSHNGTNTDFLKKMSPKISIISAGYYTDRNADGSEFTAYNYGHPRKEAIDQVIEQTIGTRSEKKAYVLKYPTANPFKFDMKKAVYCTCWDGDIVIPTDSSGNLMDVQINN